MAAVRSCIPVVFIQLDLYKKIYPINNYKPSGRSRANILLIFLKPPDSKIRFKYWDFQLKSANKSTNSKEHLA